MLEQTVDDAVKKYKSIPDYLRHVAVSITNGEMDDRPVLVKFLEDLGKYCLRGGTKFSEETLSVFAAVFNFSPAAARTFALNLFGPCDSQVRLFSKRSVAVEFCINEETLKAAANYYKSCKYKGPFEIAMDATAVTAVVRMDLKQRIQIGFVEGVEGQGPVTTGQDLYNRFSQMVNLLNVQHKECSFFFSHFKKASQHILSALYLCVVKRIGTI